MRDAGTLSPTDFPDYNWDEASLVEVKAYANSLPAAAEPPPIGHNRPPDDPGVDQTYRIGFEIPNYVSRDSVAVFQLALQEQGDHKHRLDALDQAAYRARANGDISAAAYRLYEVVRVASKGKHRCCLWDLDKIGFFAGGIDRARVSKLLTELETAKLVVILKFTEGRLGAPSSRKLFIAPAVTAEDRMDATSDRIEAHAEAAKVAALKKRAEAARKLYRCGREEPLVSPETTRNSSFTGDNENGFLVVKNEFSSFTGDNLLKHNSNSRSEEGADAPILPLYENGATATPHANGGGGAQPQPRSHSAATSAPPSTPLVEGFPQPLDRGAARKGRVAAAAAGPGEVELAVAFYNEAASKHRYRKCTTLTPQLRKRLAGRLKDIGGLENFKRAVLAVPRHRFLSGQAPKRAEDDAPFKLNIDVLLQTDGPKLGDVLHTLLDLASDEPAGAPSTKPPDTDLAPFLATLKANPSTAKHVSDERLLRVLQSVPLEEWKAYLPPDRLLSLTKGSTQ